MLFVTAILRGSEQILQRLFPFVLCVVGSLFPAVCEGAGSCVGWLHETECVGRPQWRQIAGSGKKKLVNGHQQSSEGVDKCCGELSRVTAIWKRRDRRQ